MLNVFFASGATGAPFPTAMHARLQPIGPILVGLKAGEAIKDIYLFPAYYGDVNS